MLLMSNTSDRKSDETSETSEMKIVVLVKYVPDATGERRFSADGTVDRAAGDGLLSELDEYAVGAGAADRRSG